MADAVNLRRRAVAWKKDDPFGVEYADVTLAPDRLSAIGVALGTDPVPYRLDYELETAEAFVTANLQVTARGDGWRRGLRLERSSGGVWTADASADGTIDLPAPGGELAGFSGALDPDLGLSPLFNSMPVLRHGIHLRETSVDFLMVWISVPDLQVHPSPQRYTHLGSAGPGPTGSASSRSPTTASWQSSCSTAMASSPTTPASRAASPSGCRSGAVRRSRRGGRALERYQQAPQRALERLELPPIEPLEQRSLVRHVQGRDLIHEREAPGRQPHEDAAAVRGIRDPLDQTGLLESPEAVRHRSRCPHQPAIELGRRPLEGRPGAPQAGEHVPRAPRETEARHQEVRGLVEVGGRAADARDDRHRARVEVRAHVTPLRPYAVDVIGLAVRLIHLEIKIPW
jgi:hypothetical protein